MLLLLFRILALIKKEFITIWNDPKTRAVIIGMPIMQLLVFSNAVTMEIQNIDLALLDYSNSVESRELITKFQHSSRFRNIYFSNNRDEFKELIDLQKAQIGLIINNDFARNIHKGVTTSVMIISDGRQTNSAAIAAGYSSQIIAQYNEELATASGARINIAVRHWFNPNLNYKWYILTVIVAMLSLVTTLILTSLSVARERELGTFDQLIVSPLSSIEILIGKSIPPLIIAMSLTCGMTLIVKFFFEIPFYGSFMIFILVIFISLLAIVGVGLFISSICKTQQQAILSVMTFIMPSVLLSGFISPIENMPEIWQLITWINPVRFFMVLVRGIFLKGLELPELIQNLVPLVIIAFITLTLATITFKRSKE